MCYGPPIASSLEEYTQKGPFIERHLETADVLSKHKLPEIVVQIRVVKAERDAS